MDMNQDTSTRIKNFRKMKLEQIAIEIGYVTKKPIKWTELLNYLIDNYATRARNDLIEKSNEEANASSIKFNR